MIGGVGRVVEIDESLISTKRKNNRCAVREELWIFGRVERGTGKMFALMVPRGRSREELLPILKKFIKPDTIIYSDQWGAYNQSSSFDLSTVPEKNWQDFTVNHSLHVVNPVTRVHTNTVEGKWGNSKMDLKKLCGLTKELKPAYIDHHLWLCSLPKDPDVFMEMSNLFALNNGFRPQQVVQDDQ